MFPETNDLQNYPMKVLIYFQKADTDRLLWKNISSVISQLMNVFTVLAHQIHTCTNNTMKVFQNTV